MSGSGQDPATPQATVVLVVEGRTDQVVAEVDAGAPDLGLVDAILRLQLAARRSGGTLRFEHVSDELARLLRFVGVASCLGLEPDGQPELGEHLGVEEVVQPRDPPA